MDKLLYPFCFSLLLAWLNFALPPALQAQTDTEKIAAALEKAGIDKPSAQSLGKEIGAIAVLYQQLSDSTIKYPALLKYQTHYQAVSNILSAKKITPQTVIAAWPAAKEMLSAPTMRVVKRKIADLEASDESVKYLKVFIALENEMQKNELGKSQQYDAMAAEYLKRIDAWKKSNPEFESFFLDLRLTVSSLTDVYKTLQSGTGADKLKISKEFRACVKRLRNVDFHHDSEFIQKFKVSSLVEQTIVTGEFLCDNVK